VLVFIDEVLLEDVVAFNEDDSGFVEVVNGFVDVEIEEHVPEPGLQPVPQ